MLIINITWLGDTVLPYFIKILQIRIRILKETCLNDCNLHLVSHTTYILLSQCLESRQSLRHLLFFKKRLIKSVREPLELQWKKKKKKVKPLALPFFRKSLKHAYAYGQHNLDFYHQATKPRDWRASQALLSSTASIVVNLLCLL